mmetsp:Transcript_19028/g.64260  ORF Transcript_19028/g.64260 Transcript_19028/m.64260 type:complete len:291 (+) Transcript_19028:136-1008(+)
MATSQHLKVGTIRRFENRDLLDVESPDLVQPCLGHRSLSLPFKRGKAHGLEERVVVCGGLLGVPWRFAGPGGLSSFFATVWEEALHRLFRRLEPRNDLEDGAFYGRRRAAVRGNDAAAAGVADEEPHRRLERDRRVAHEADRAGEVLRPGVEQERMREHHVAGVAARLDCVLGVESALGSARFADGLGDASRGKALSPSAEERFRRVGMRPRRQRSAAAALGDVREEKDWQSANLRRVRKVLVAVSVDVPGTLGAPRLRGDAGERDDPPATAVVVVDPFPAAAELVQRFA